MGIPLMLTERGERANVQNERALFTVHRFWRNAEINQVCPKSGASFRQLDAFRISFWNKEIGTRYSALAGQTALLRRSSLVQ
jgi:hypothetical protein